MTLVIDASVALKWFMEEAGSDTARRILDSGEELTAPDLIIAEACNGGWKAERRHLMSAEQVDRMARRLPRVFTRLHPAVVLAPLAIGIARDLDHPVYDCFYLALAERESAPMVTADRRLTERVKQTPWHARIRLLSAFPAEE